MNKQSNIQLCAKLIQLVKPLTGYMLLAILLGLLGHLAATFISVLAAYALVGSIGYEISISMNTLFICLGTLAISRGVLHYGEQASNHYIAFTILAILRNQVFIALRKLCPAKLEGKGKGNLISIITSDIELLEVFYAHTISPIVIALLMSIVMTTFIASFHIVLGSIALLSYLCIGILIPLYISKSNKQNGILFREKSGQLSSYVLESLRGLKEIRQYNQGHIRLQGIQNQSEALSNEEKKMKIMVGRNMALSNTAVLLCSFMLLFTAIYLYQIQAISFIGIVLSFVALISSFGPLIALASLGSTLQNTFAAGRRVLSILEEEPLVEEIVGKPTMRFKEVTLSKVSFAYEQEEVISHVNLQISNNSIVGISGQSGSGKSTLLKLLMRFYKAPKDSIHMGGRSIEDINTTDLRNMESFMSQETHLFQGTILDNIKLAKLDATFTQIQVACKKAALHDFIMCLPNQYDSVVSELGESLSGGEKQRIGLARAFLHDAPLLLLDEPTSNLDSLNEAKILQAIDQQRDHKSVVLVSHRPSTMRLADVVYHMAEGRVS